MIDWKKERKEEIGGLETKCEKSISIFSETVLKNRKI
jgi:hypothetical protein